MDDMDVVLQTEPKNRLALVYRAIACLHGGSGLGRNDSFFGPLERWISVRSETREKLSAWSQDPFCRIISLSARDKLVDRSLIQSELHDIVDTDPTNLLAWSALAGHSFFLRALEGDRKWRLPAVSAACEALRLCWNDRLAFSVLWWSTDESDSQSFFESLGTGQSFSEQKRLVNDPLNTGFTFAFDRNLLPFDKSLRFYLQLK